MECTQLEIIKLLKLDSGTNQLKILTDKGIAIIIKNSDVANRRTYDAIQSVHNYYEAKDNQNTSLDDLAKKSKIKKDDLDIKIKTFKLNKLKQEIVLIDDARNVYAEQINIAKQTLLGMGTRLCEQLTDESNTNRIRLMIDNVINLALENLSEGKGKEIRKPDIQKIIRDLDKGG